VKLGMMGSYFNSSVCHDLVCTKEPLSAQAGGRGHLGVVASPGIKGETLSEPQAGGKTERPEMSSLPHMNSPG
jgi:hypothetical protein